MQHGPETLTVAIATLDGEAMAKGHFGEAPRFDLYRLSAQAATPAGSLDNPRAGDGYGGGHHEHHGHGGGDGHSGAGIGRLLGEAGAQVMVSRGFGPNIKNLRRRFLPVLVHVDRVSEAITQLQAHWMRVQEHWLQGEERRHLVLRPSGPDTAE